MAEKKKGKENVECTRCGNQWHSIEFEQENKIPQYCSRCYQQSVRKIPEPPTKFDKIANASRETIDEFPQKVLDTKQAIQDFRETNRMLVGMINTAIIITTITIILVYVIFSM